jgi:two-component system, chemotaxis family, chemotaxis protein CheY
MASALEQTAGAGRPTTRLSATELAIEECKMEASRQWRGATERRDAVRDDESACVLVVDDDAAVRLVCAINLEAEGLYVIEAADGNDALDQMRRECPDLLLTDVMMPGLDGFDLVERLRRDERTRRVPVIFLSGETRLENAERARALGALAYLTKPFDPRGLAALVTRALVGAAPVSMRAQAPARTSLGGSE